MSEHHTTCHHRTYYLTCEEYELLWDFARGRCQICHAAPEETKRGRLCIDHMGDYGYGAVRGLLCDRCNRLMRSVDANEIAYPGSAVYHYRANAWFLVYGMHLRGFRRSPIQRRWEWPGSKMLKRFERPLATVAATVTTRKHPF